MAGLGNFYGADWIGMAGNLLGLWYISKQRKRGFLLGSIGCMGWSAFGVMTQSVPSVLSNVLYIGINFRAWYKWKKKPPQNPESTLNT
jgi:nicotinamide riboside transporter PnuC